MREPEGVVALQGRNDNNPGSDDRSWNAPANMQTGMRCDNCLQKS